jgi:hypothetical protein
VVQVAHLAACAAPATASAAKATPALKIQRRLAANMGRPFRINRSGESKTPKSLQQG